MKKIFFLFCFVLVVTGSFAQYKYDNVLYKTVYTQDICKELNSHPGYLLIDVRTPGEYADTASRGLNIGRFRNAVNMEVSELGKHIGEILAYKDKPVFVYCSHSQRSRKASKLLADSGFTQVFNINGGMTGVRELPLAGNDCIYDKLETNTVYNIISASDLCSKISKAPKNIFLLDVRNDSAFDHISLDAKINAFGYFKNSTHIALADLENNLSKIPAGKEIIVIDLFGRDAVKAAELLKHHNYSNVSILPEGLDRMNSTNSKDLPCLSTAYVTHIPYRIINTQDLKSFLETTKDFLFLDARTTEEFTNKHKNYWQNIGHLQNAVNIPLADLENQWEKISAWKTKPVIIYVFGSGTAMYEAANILAKKGFTDIRVLQGGIFNIGWTAANIKGYSSLAELRVDVPLENQ
jgi:rhodanese-related sulfurtransferase